MDWFSIEICIEESVRKKTNSEEIISNSKINNTISLDTNSNNDDKINDTYTMETIEYNFILYSFCTDITQNWTEFP